MAATKKILVLFDTRLAQHGGTDIVAGVDNVYPKEPGDALVMSDGAMPLATIVNNVVVTANVMLRQSARLLRIYCHGFEARSQLAGGGREAPKVGGFGLKLGKENLDQQNARIVQTWVGLFDRIVIYGCGAAHDEAIPSGGRLQSTGTAVCSQLAIWSKTEIIASDSDQPYQVGSDGSATFGALRGQIYSFDAATGLRRLYTGGTDDL
jgi:hypothetical protein